VSTTPNQPETEKSAFTGAESEGRSLVLVAGSGRSGTSLFAGILQRLGYTVPKPEVPADETNPRGFAESQWVVDFHTRLLESVSVNVSDARPDAWARTAQLCLDDDVQRELRGWLSAQLADAGHVVAKDPRLSWFLPLWRKCAEDLGTSPRYAMLLRHPAAVIESKQRSYGTWQGDVDRTACWLNQTLFTERATREGRRAFVRYDDLLDDWTREIGRVGDTLGLAVVRNVPAQEIVQVHEFVDRGLSRSRASWDGFEIPAPLREQADRVWELASQLVATDADVDAKERFEAFDAARAAYVELYEDAQAIAQSSIDAARRDGGGGKPGRAIRIMRRVPTRYRRKVPARLRVTLSRSLNRTGFGVL
jgi:hypothetical protein